MIWNLPNVLTWLRILAIPLIVVLFMVGGSTHQSVADPIAGLLFAAASTPVLVSAGALFLLGRLPLVRNRAAGVEASSSAMPSLLSPASEGPRP